MKKALLHFPADGILSARLEPILLANGLTPWPIDPETLFTRSLEATAVILLLDGDLFASHTPEEQKRLATLCSLKHLSVLITGRSPQSSPPPTDLPWTCGVIRNSTDAQEWGEKIMIYQQLGALEREVFNLRNKIATHWREVEEDLRSAAQIQQSLLPKRLPSLPHFNVSCHFQPFEKIGGDLFNLCQIDEETMMLFLLDVSGHGISSALVSVSIYQSLSLQTGQIVKRMIDRPPYYRILSPIEVMTALSREYPFERFELFFTIIYMLINIHTGETRYCSAGHPPALLQRKNGEQQRLSIGGGLIGLPGTGPFEEERLTLHQGDRLFLFSDGLIDHCDNSGECFGEKRLIENLTSTERTLQQSCLAGIDAMYNFRGEEPPQDDVSLLGIEFTKSDAQSRP